MYFILFLIAAIVTIYVATKLSTFADVISEKTAVGGMLIGAMLLGGATSLPEITTSYTSIMLDSPDLATGNLLGSNLFNLLILAGLDLYFRKEKLYEKVWTQHRYTAFIGILLSLIILFSLRHAPILSILGIGIETFFLLGLYIASMIFLSRLAKKAKGKDKEPERDDATPNIPVRKAMIGFGISAVIILISGTTLTIAGDQIAIITGLGASFVGSFLIALSTSLPEAVAVLVAFRIRNFNLGIGSILGSNLFNILILAGTDIFYRPAPLSAAVEPVHQITATLVIILYLITFYSLVREKQLKPAHYAIPSALVVTFYLVSTYYVFIYS